MDARVSNIELIRTQGLTSAERRAVSRQLERGQLVRIAPGVHVEPAGLDDLDGRTRHQLLIRALLPRVGPSRALSHLSAVAAFDLPHVGTWPDRLHVRTQRHERTDRTPWFVTHGSLPRLALARGTVDGVAVVAGARTMVDVAESLPFAEAVVIIDHLLRTTAVTKADIVAELERSGSRAPTQVTSVLEFGSALSASPAESLCRVRFRQLSTSTPVEQARFSGPGHADVFVDFWFPVEGVIVEVDGRGKYEDQSMLHGRSTAEAHWAEKRREDWLRSRPGVRGFVRVTWPDLMTPDRLRAKLRAAGVACR
jgi:hypothetical protein